ncbi:MAG TPA: cupin domain-containing protein [Acidobacteriota bacterium]|nr:cupin domain-containing protein [Acidobacteriota bacterium]
MDEQFYPELIRGLPEVDINWPGLRGWALISKDGQAVFMECDQETRVGDHSHGAQFGVVLRGSLELTIEGETQKLKPGDSYSIPAGAVHSAILSPGFNAIDVFEETDRYKIKERQASE